jgi:ribonuclease P protein component
MLAAKYNIKDSERIERVKRKGKLFQSDNFAIAYLQTDDSDHSSFAFIVSKNISKLATQRNRIKRVLSETVRQNLKYIKEGYDIVFLPKRSIEKVHTGEIMDEVIAAFKKANLVKRQN